MKKKISDLIIMSDVDGTLLNHDDNIPQRNLAALRRFMAGGGRFGIATGRSLQYTRKIAEHLSVNFPCIVFNGGMIYDFQNGEVLTQTVLPAPAKSYIQEIMARFPRVGVMVVNREHYYDITAGQKHELLTTAEVLASDLASITGPWYKIILVLDQISSEDLMDFVENRQYKGVRFVYTSPTMFEMIPETSSKGAALKKLMEQKGFGADQLAAIGDYYNDVEMLKLAELGVAVAEAPDDIKYVADLVVGPCMSGAVADLVEYLENSCGY